MIHERWKYTSVLLWRINPYYFICIEIIGYNGYLYIAVGSKGNAIDFYVSEHRDKVATLKFFMKALNANHTQRP